MNCNQFLVAPILEHIWYCDLHVMVHTGIGGPCAGSICDHSTDLLWTKPISSSEGTHSVLKSCSGSVIMHGVQNNILRTHTQTHAHTHT